MRRRPSPRAWRVIQRAQRLRPLRARLVWGSGESEDTRAMRWHDVRARVVMVHWERQQPADYPPHFLLRPKDRARLGPIKIGEDEPRARFRLTTHARPVWGHNASARTARRQAVARAWRVSYAWGSACLSWLRDAGPSPLRRSRIASPRARSSSARA